MDIKELIKGELIGKKIIVLDSKNSKKLEGMIIDETKNLFVIEDDGERKKIIKGANVFGFYESQSNTNFVKVKGSLLIGRPEDRIKSKVKNEKRIK